VQDLRFRANDLLCSDSSPLAPFHRRDLWKATLWPRAPPPRAPGHGNSAQHHRPAPRGRSHQAL